MNYDPDLWYQLENAGEVASPALVLYPDRIEENIRRMIRAAGGVDRLRPHLKTHKLAEVVQMQMVRGIARFKCATIAEAEMAAECGAADLLLAYQPVGPNIGRLIDLVLRYPGTRFAAIVDDATILLALSNAFSAASLTLTVLLDIDCGMHRTGVPPGPAAIELYQRMANAPGLRAGGLHVYDGHIHEQDVALRAAQCEIAFKNAAGLREELIRSGHPVPAVVAGGTPTFPMHARRGDVECSPGTCLLWDAGYRAKLPDLDYLWAAAVLTRVVSKPGGGRLCLDLGHKAVASENPHPRVEFLAIPDARAVTHSEEHLVIETAQAGRFAVGDELFGIPWHICPTVALHAQAVVARSGRAEGCWRIKARERMIHI